jgi:hypothetical protein
MNDPHVVSLTYKIIVGEGVRFEAPPLSHSTAHFDLRATEKEATFTFRTHFPSISEARKIVDPFVTAWGILSGLNSHPQDFRLEYDRADVLDRNPSKGSVITGTALQSFSIIQDARVTAVRPSLPEVPFEFCVFIDVESMYAQYKLYTEGKIPLPQMAYFCMTILCYNKDAPKYYEISNKIIKKAKQLSTKRGGSIARKAVGTAKEFSENEKQWLEAAVKLLIRRAGVRAASPSGSLRQLTMADLPSL